MDLPVLMQKHEEKKRSKYDEKPKHKRTESTDSVLDLCGVVIPVGTTPTQELYILYISS